MLQLSKGPLHAGLWQHRASLLKHFIRTIQLTQITLDCLVDLTQLLTQLTARIILGLGIQSFEPAAINGNDIAV